MTVEELAQQCATQLSNGFDFITLNFPGYPPPSGKVRLAKRGAGKCPMGEVLCWTQDGGTVASFSAMDVLAYLAAIGAVDVRFKSEDDE